MMFPFGKTGHKPLSKKSFLGFLTAEEILAQIEEDETVTSAMVFIQPPSDIFDSEGDSGDEDTGDSVNNLSRKRLQANAEARIVSISRSREGNEGDSQSGGLFDFSADSPRLPLETESSFFNFWNRFETKTNKTMGEKPRFTAKLSTLHTCKKNILRGHAA